MKPYPPPEEKLFPRGGGGEDTATCRLTRDGHLQEVSNSDLTYKLLVFWKTGSLREVVTLEKLRPSLTRGGHN